LQESLSKINWSAKNFILRFILCYHAVSSAQNNGSIYGNLVDTILKQPVQDATITILHGEDSSLVTFGRTNQKGFFDIKFLSKGRYRLLATHVSYRNFTRYFDISEDAGEINAGYIIMHSEASVLKEVTVSHCQASVYRSSSHILR
jgi:hypothetical protein